MDILKLNALDIENPPGRKNEINEIKEMIRNKQHLILLGPRRVGKTTLLNAIKKQIKHRYKVIKYDCMEDPGNKSALFAYLFAFSKSLKIFVSSIGKKDKGELSEERSLAEKIIKEANHEPFLIENLPDPNPPLQVEEDNIKNSDVLLLILGNEYSENVEDEYKLAKYYNIPVYCMVKGSDDSKREDEIIKMLEEIKKNKVYHRYNDATEFEKTLKEILHKENEKWRKMTFDRYKNKKWEESLENFFESLENQKEKILFLIDEFGEIKKSEDDKEFEQMCKQMRAGIEKMKDKIFILTGSVNVFTISSQKPFIIFSNYLVKPFEKNIAIEVLKEILNTINVKIDDKTAEKVIEVIGTLPADLQLFALRALQYKNVGEINVKIAQEIIKKTVEEERSKQDIFSEKIDENAKEFLKRVIPYLPATKEEIKRIYYEPDDKIEKILETVTDSYFILKKDGDRYFPYSNMLYLTTVHKQNKEKFNEIINKLQE